MFARTGPPEGMRFASVSASNTHACGVHSETGFVHCWGDAVAYDVFDAIDDDVYGEIPDAISSALQPPSEVPFTSVAVGEGVSCGVRAVDGKVACWGTFAMNGG